MSRKRDPQRANKYRSLSIAKDCSLPSTKSEAKKMLLATGAPDKNGSTEKAKMKSFKFVIQKYIEKPLLYKQRKFDIRCYAMLNQNMDLFAFE